MNNASAAQLLLRGNPGQMLGFQLTSVAQAQAYKTSSRTLWKKSSLYFWSDLAIQTGVKYAWGTVPTLDSVQLV